MNLTWKALTIKTITLLTLACVNELRQPIKYIEVEEDKIKTVLPSLLKQIQPGKHLKPVTLKSYKTD